MALDFPSTPSVGDLYPVTPIPGVPQYRWSGSAWMAVDIPTPPSGGGVEAGTVMLFYQPAAPTGWTKQVTHNDKALRVVSGVGGASGGSNPFSTVMAQSVVGNTTLPLAGVPAGITTSGVNTVYVYGNGDPSKTLAYFGPSGSATSYQLFSAGSTNVWVIGGVGASNTYATSNYSGSNTITATSTNTGGGSHNHPITMNIQYLDMILASKD